MRSTVQNAKTIVSHANTMGMTFTTGLMLALVAITLVMWALNVIGLMGINLIPFFIGAIYIVAKSTSLKVVTVAGTLGAASAFLNDKDMSQGVAGGISTLGRIIWGGLLGWFILAGFLSSWSFSNNPGAFFYVAAASLTAMVLLQFYQITTGKWLVGGVLIYCAIIAFLALASTSPTLVRVGAVLDKQAEATLSYIEGKDDGTHRSSIDVRCQDERGGALPRCAIMTLSDIPIDVFAPSGHCLFDNPGQSMDFAASPKGPGWWSLTSKSGETVQVGIYKPRVGDRFFGVTCI